MKGAELLETYPKAAAAIKEFYYAKMIESLQEDNDIPQEFKDMVKAQQFDSEYVATFIDTNPRFLFDILDANEVMISVKYGVDGFTWHITQLPFSEIKDTTVYTFRKDAEIVAVEKAFEILNEKL